MSLIHRRTRAVGETPQQTLERLNHASSHRPTATDEFRRPRLKVRYIAETYDMAEVDAFIDSIDRRTADEIHNVHFTTVILRGYDKARVDNFLDECEARLTMSKGAPLGPSRSASKLADPTWETTGRAPTASHGGQITPVSRRAGDVVAGLFWLITLGGGLFLWILIEEDLSWSAAAVVWVLGVVGVSLLFLLLRGFDRLGRWYSALDGTSWWHTPLGLRLARIPQRRWTPICLAFWVGLCLWVGLGTALSGVLLPEARQDGANGTILIAALAAVLIFWVLGVSRTKHMDPSDWTDVQRASRYIWDHMGDGGGF